MPEDAWAALADQFVDEAYASVEAKVRTYVRHRHLLEHLPPAPASLLDVGGGGNQSLSLAAAGYDLTLLDPSEAMLAKARRREGAKARRRVATLTPDARVTLVQADGLEAAAATGRRFDAVLCHGVLGYLDDPEPLVDQLTRCAAPGGLISIMTANARDGRPPRDGAALGRRARCLRRPHRGQRPRRQRPPTPSTASRRCSATAASNRSHGSAHGCSSTGWSSAGRRWTRTTPTRSRASSPSSWRRAGAIPYRALSRVFHLLARATT